jgi:tetratricopeptide (TPR) repeat protein
MSSDDLKTQGNVAFNAGNFDEAIRLYSAAIEADGSNHILYSNRAAAYLGANKNAEALEDADRAIELNPSFMKSYYRKSTALQNLGRWKESWDTWLVAKSHCEKTAQLDAHVLNSKQQWIAAMRTATVESAEDLAGRYRLLPESRERLSILAHFWNESTKSERANHFACFLRLIGGPTAAIEEPSIDPEGMIDMPMHNYADLPVSRIPSWISFFRGLSSENKTDLLARIWGILNSQEQNAVILDLRSFFHGQI